MTSALLHNLTGSSAGELSSAASGQVAITVDHLAKRYKVYPRPMDVLIEALTHRPRHREVWALRDVTFRVARGEIVGVIGANGAGKSTLLRILAGTLDATEGTSQIHGQLRAILQLGTGFQDEYTGRQNIFMGGYCLGYTKAQIEESLEWIINFSGLGDVIDQPFKTYSSGMRGRLTFAVTFCRHPDILIVDEALATGDLGFQQRCINRILELSASGATALVVSHSMYIVEKLCSRALYIRHGRLVDDGPCRQITRAYERELLDEFRRKDSPAAAARQIVTAEVKGPLKPPVASSASSVVQPVELGRTSREHSVAIDDNQVEKARLEAFDRIASSFAESPPNLPATTLPDVPLVAPAVASQVLPSHAADANAPASSPMTNPAAAASSMTAVEPTMTLSQVQHLLDDPEEVCPPLLHLELVRLRQVRILNGAGDVQDMFHTGSPVSIEIEVESQVSKDDVVVGIQIHDERDTHVATTTNRAHIDQSGIIQSTPFPLRRGRQVFRVHFPNLALGAGRYHVGVGISPKARHFTPADQLLRERRVAHFAVFRDDVPRQVLYDPPCTWSCADVLDA